MLVFCDDQDTKTIIMTELSRRTPQHVLTFSVSVIFGGEAPVSVILVGDAHRNIGAYRLMSRPRPWPRGRGRARHRRSPRPPFIATDLASGRDEAEQEERREEEEEERLHDVTAGHTARSHSSRDAAAASPFLTPPSHETQRGVEISLDPF